MANKLKPLELYAVIVVDCMERIGAEDVTLSLHRSRVAAEGSVILEAQEAYDEEATGLASGRSMGEAPVTFDSATEFLGYDGEDFSLEVRRVVVS